MKYTLFASAIALSCSFAIAEPHGYQLQVGSSELDPSIWEGPELAFEPVKARSRKDSRSDWFETANVDGDRSFHFVGTIVPSGPTRISLYEAYRGSPEGTAYRDYYERFPADTDWSAIADAHKPRDGDV